MKILPFLLPLTLLGAADLVKEVRHELVTLPYYGVFDNLSYKVEGSKVTLFGQARLPVLKDDAGKAVKGIEGVTAVDNQIEVLPVSPNDDNLRIAVYRAIYSKPALQRYQMSAVPPIHIIVKNGDVALEGVVANSGDKDTAGIAAKGVSGTHNVINNLKTDK
jgi:hyperosmotically inducible protein